jgi:argininosuccinate synthase
MKTMIITALIAWAVISTGRGNDAEKPSYYVEISDGWMKVYAVEGETHWLARVKTDVWAKALERPMPKTKDDRRHFALNLVAAAIAGDGEREKSTTDPDVRMVSVEESRQNGQPGTVTIERGICFSILRDSDPKERVYRAYIIMFTLPKGTQPIEKDGPVALS